MVNEHQAKQLKAAGLTAYNHNLDTSRGAHPTRPDRPLHAPDMPLTPINRPSRLPLTPPLPSPLLVSCPLTEHYPSVISTRTYDDRLQTIKNVRAAGISVCCGGILGLGETEDDRIGKRVHAHTHKRPAHSSITHPCSACL